ncbi:hypothetical protein RHSP_53496 [Rhizobium freirei PRF 81]|uniref:Uncharacterized protein n=1 Tax=Rhizobium freirei PRF 81 TaxID=363754 RepID=N6V2K5_9HYPH|nr:hypothetical protein RHSP_53496 [Rhizobium freirei PRF 81]
MLDDDALHAERDGLIDHVGLHGCILAAVEHLQLDAKRLGLRLDTGEIGLEEIAGREISHERNLHIAGLIERLWHVGGKGWRTKCRRSHQAERQYAQRSACHLHISLLLQ